MGIERPSGPYAAEMTASPAWPDVDETTLLDAADAFDADSKAVDEQLWVFQQARSRLFDDQAWSGQAADAAHAKHRQQIDRLQSHVQGSAATAKLYRDCAAVVVHTKQQVIENAENTQKEIAQLANHPQATAEQKDYFIKGLVNAAHTENVQLVEAGAARLGKPPASPKFAPADNSKHNGVQPVDHRTFKDAPAKEDAGIGAEQRQTQIDAFKHVFGHAPTSRADWDTAAALDPHSYDPKYGGVPPNISVGRITPHPGQGVVRTNLFIPGHDVLDPQLTSLPHNNLGDNRSFSPSAGPEASRVSILVDYENGIIVARQNPSVDATTGAIQAGTPTVSAVQRSDGGILLHYNAADPFSPGGQGLAKGIPFSVNGELAITPTPSGPVVGGNVTNFPAIEVYHDGAAGAPQVLAQQWPLVSDGSTGPGAGLWWHRPIGDASLVLGFNDLYPPLPGAAPGAGAPFLPHGHVPAPVPAAPPLIATPPGLSDLGSVDAPPVVRHHGPVVMLPPLPR
jgi:hypothetical protein